MSNKVIASDSSSNAVESDDCSLCEQKVENMAEKTKENNDVDYDCEINNQENFPSSFSGKWRKLWEGTKRFCMNEKKKIDEYSTQSKFEWKRWLLIQALVCLAKLIVIFIAIGIIGAYSLYLYYHPTEGVASYSGADFEWEYDRRFNPRTAVNSSSYGVNQQFQSSYAYKGQATSPNDYTFLLDAHIHSSYSDGSLRGSKVIEWAISNGYNGIVLSDHNRLLSSVWVR